MNFLKMTAIAVALAMDAFAVAIAVGVSLKTVSLRQTFRLSWHFGLFQALMPIIGWSAGISLRMYIEHYAHWVAFALLVFVGGHMIMEALEAEEKKSVGKDPTKGLKLVLLSIATSIDALAVGLSLSLLHQSIGNAALVIGIVAGMFTVAGLYIGKIIGAVKGFRRYAEIAGGLVLLVIGMNILYEHQVFDHLF
jgi:putative Mn2+ efflux pump MntP